MGLDPGREPRARREMIFGCRQCEVFYRETRRSFAGHAQHASGSDYHRVRCADSEATRRPRPLRLLRRLVVVWVTTSGDADASVNWEPSASMGSPGDDGSTDDLQYVNGKWELSQ